MAANLDSYDWKRETSKGIGKVPPPQQGSFFVPLGLTNPGRGVAYDGGANVNVGGIKGVAVDFSNHALVAKTVFYNTTRDEKKAPTFLTTIFSTPLEF